MMKTTNQRTLLSRILCAALIAVMALGMTGCSENNTEAKPSAASIITVENGAELGEGATTFPLTITDANGIDVHVTIHTDQTLVGEALQEVGLIVGEEGPFGLYIKAVNGIPEDYDADGAYWAFYINGNYANSGVDTTEIVAGDEYALMVEQG